MQLIQTAMPGLAVIESRVFGDNRGYFLESYNEAWFAENVSDTTFIQDNESKSSRGTLRGLHFQLPPYAQAKLVRVIQGEVVDVVVDLRKDSPTFGQSLSVILNDENKKQLFIPRGFAHGFAVLSETAIFSYKVDNIYAPQHESGLIWNDPTLNINWGIDPAQVLLSAKDKELPLFADLKSPF